jgi:multicomponent Na+:H+ antiporter subunit D
MLTFMVIVPVLLAVLLFALSSNNAAKLIAIVFQFALFVASVYLVLTTRDTDIVTYIGSYDSVLGIVLRATGLSAVFVTITTFIFLAVSVYSYSYKGRKDARTFWFLMFLLEASFLGLFLSGDFFNIFVLLEVSTLVIVILTMYDRQNRNILYGKIFLLVNVVAIQFYLLGLGYIYRLTGALDMERAREILAVTDRQNLILPYAFIMTAIAFKSTLIPFFSWIPKVHLYPKAPTVVAAIISGLQAKTALYLFIRFQEIFAPVAAHDFFLVMGIVTGLFGAIMAVCQSNIKMILAYHTISQIGLMTIGFTVGSEQSYIGGLYHAIAHAIFKTTLFLCAGIFIRSYGTADVYKIRGVMKRMPVVGIATVLAVFGITGAPFFIGSVSKYFITFQVNPFIMVTTVIIGFGTIVSFIKFSTMFFGQSSLQGDTPKPEISRVVPVFMMGLVCLVGGLFGTELIYFFFRLPVGIETSSYLLKAAIFFASCIAGYFVYIYAVKENPHLTRLGTLHFNFKYVVAVMGVFMAVLLLLLG